MVVYRHGKKLLRPVLTDDILVEEFVYLLWLMKRLHFFKRLGSRLGAVKILEIIPGKLHTFRTDACIKSLKKKRNLILAPSAEHAVSAVFIRLGHITSFL